MKGVKTAMLLTLLAVAYTKGNEVEISDDYYNVIVAFSKIDSHNVRFILCLGALIRSNLVFLSLECNEKLYPRHKIAVQTGTEFFKEKSPENIIEESLGKVFKISMKFVILRLTKDIERISRLKVDHVRTCNQQPDNAALVGWNETHPIIQKVSAKVGVTIKLEMETEKDYNNFLSGSLLVIDYDIAALTRIDKYGRIRFYKVVFEEAEAVDSIIEMENNPKDSKKRKRKMDVIPEKDKYYQFV